MVFVAEVGELDDHLACAFDPDNLEGVGGEGKVVDPVADFAWEVAETFAARLAGSRRDGRTVRGKSYDYTVGVRNLFWFWDWDFRRKVIENVLHGWKGARFGRG